VRKNPADKGPHFTDLCVQTHQLMPQMQTVAELVFAAVEVDDA